MFNDVKKHFNENVFVQACPERAIILRNKPLLKQGQMAVKLNVTINLTAKIFSIRNMI